MSYLDTLNQTATLAPVTGTDDYSKPTFGTPVTIKTRVVLKGATKFGSMAGRGSNNELYTISAVARVAPDLAVESGDKFTFDGKVYKVLAPRKVPNHLGQPVAMNLELTLWPSL